MFQLVSYNGFTEGGWHLLKGPFFNGEGLWTHNALPGGFSEEARDFLRRTFAILHRYEDAFTSGDVEPLVPTLAPAVYANRFTGGRRTVWTLFHAGFSTFRSEALSVPARPGLRFHDAFTGKEIRPRRQGERLLVPVVLGPRDVGCVVME